MSPDPFLACVMGSGNEIIVVVDHVCMCMSRCMRVVFDNFIF